MADPLLDLINGTASAPSATPKIELTGMAVPDAPTTVDPLLKLVNPTGVSYAPDAPASAAVAPDAPASTSQMDDAFNAAGHHLMNMPHGLTQMIENGVNFGASKLPDNPLSRYINQVTQQDNAAAAQREADYQKSTPNSVGAYAGATAGELLPFAASVFANGIKAVGNTTATLASKVAPSSTLLPQMVGGAAQGTTMALAQPVASGNDYWASKGDQLQVGAAGGALAPPVIRGLGAVLAPTASAAWNNLNKAGVTTTIGQRLGGVANTLESAAQSIPVIGDFIANARSRSLQSWNAATLNDVVKPIKETVSAVGHEGVAEAGDKLSNAYNTVLNKVGGVKFDQKFAQEFGQLKQLTTGLTPDMAARFNQIISNGFESRLSPAGGLDAQTLKIVASDVGNVARKYSGSSVASEQEMGHALTQFNSLIDQQISRSYPTLAPMLDAIDTGWAKLVRVEGAAKAAATNKVNTGVFTPGQLMTAVKAADTSVRDRATARGQALMQGWAQDGLKVLGEKVPDSGTALRAGNASLATLLAVQPQYIPLAVGAGTLGGAMYSKTGQGLLNAAATNRPQILKNLSQGLLDFVPQP